MVVRSVFFLSLFLAAFAKAEEPVETSDEAVRTLTDANFDDFLKANPVSLVEFYAPWCGHCKALAPEYEKAAATLKEKGSIPLAKVDATVETGLGQRFNIRGYPTLKIFRNGEPEDYRGGRSHDTIVSYIEQVTGPAVISVKTDTELSAIKEKEPTIFVGHFEKEEGDHHDLFVKVADSLRTKGKFVAFIHTDNVGEVHVHRKDEDVVVHKITEEVPLKDFVSREFFPLFGPISGENYADYTGLGLEMVWFCAKKEDFESTGKAMREVASEFREKYSFVWLDSDQYGSHAESALGVSDFPAVVLQAEVGRFVFPEKTVDAAVLKKFFLDVQSGKIEKKLKSEEIPETNDEAVKVVVGKNFEDLVFQSDKDVMLEVYAPWCGHCKKLEPIYQEFAELLQTNKVDHVVIAKMDGVANESPSSEFEWSGFPTIFYVKAGEKVPVRFDGARTLEGLTEYIKKKASKEVVIKDAEPAEEVKEEL